MERNLQHVPARSIWLETKTSPQMLLGVVWDRACSAWRLIPGPITVVS